MLELADPLGLACSLLRADNEHSLIGGHSPA